MPNYTNSLWSETAPPTPRYPALAGDVTYDVAVIGGGITGLSAACLLQQAGRRVAVIEALRIGKGETGKTTAHLTAALDTRYHVLTSRFGADGARLAAEGQRAAIDRIARFVDELKIACDFRRVPGFLYAESAEDKDELLREAAAAQRAGLAAEVTSTVPLPFPTALGLRFDHQATFHPRLYLQALADAFVAGGGAIHEETPVRDVQDGRPCRVISERGVVTASAVIVAAHVPITNRLLLHSKLAAYRTYALAVEMPFETDGLFWDMGDPYHYTRRQSIDGRTYVVVGGEDHKVGEADDTTIPFERLEAYVRARYRYEPAATDYRWSGQIIESADGLPYVGRNSLSSHVFVASGYSGNGMTNGTLAAMVLAEEVCGRQSRFRELLDATRIKPLASAKAFVAENVDYPKHLLKDRLPLPGAAELARLPPGEGEVLSLGGRRLAVYRNANGELSAVARLHAPRLPGSLEHDREELGLPLPWQPLRSARPRPQRAGGHAAGSEAAAVRAGRDSAARRSRSGARGRRAPATLSHSESLLRGVEVNAQANRRVVGGAPAERLPFHREDFEPHGQEQCGQQRHR